MVEDSTDIPVLCQCMKTRTLLTTAQAAEYIGRPVRTLDQWRYLGQGPAFLKLVGAVRYDLDDIHAWLDAGRVDPNEAA